MSIPVSMMFAGASHVMCSPPPDRAQTTPTWFGEGAAWTSHDFRAAVNRMWGRILGVEFTDQPGRVMTAWMGYGISPSKPTDEDIARARAVWGTEARK